MEKKSHIVEEESPEFSRYLNLVVMDKVSMIEIAPARGHEATTILPGLQFPFMRQSFP